MTFRSFAGQARGAIGQGALLIALAWPEPAGAAPGAIDRHALVTRHNLEWNVAADPIPLGNGEFCFNADGTGLQTFAGNTMAHWAWHSFPLPEGWTPDRVPATGTFQHGRNLPTGDVFPAGTEAIRDWMRDNPHALNLARIRLWRSSGAALVPADITRLTRRLDLWTGLHTSRFELDGETVEVTTCVHPELDAVAVRIESPLVSRGELQVEVDFPYPSLLIEPWVGDFTRDTGHTTTLARRSARHAELVREADDARYGVSLDWSEGGALAAAAAPRRALVIRHAEYGADNRWADVTAGIAAAVAEDRVLLAVNCETMGENPAPNVPRMLRVAYTLGGKEANAEVPDGRLLRLQAEPTRHAYRLAAAGRPALEFVCAFSPGAPAGPLPSYAGVRRAAAARWEAFWNSGGAIDLSGSRDPRWRELERRIVLSQYQMAAQSAGSWPSAEAGLMTLDQWRGRFHMEMVWWHLAHYALWDRWPLAERALGCYARFLPVSRQLAAQLGYEGAQWPKSVGPGGRSAPWYANQILLWKQPHPIFFAELDYRLHPTPATLAKWSEIVRETARFLADYPVRAGTEGRYSLAPATPPSELGITRDTVFDLAYWRWGLDTAQVWRERQGLAREPRWDEVRRRLAPLPEAEGVFIHSPQWKDTYTRRAWEHPDPIGVLGQLPPLEGVDRETAHRTVRKVWAAWDWRRCWGWDFPWMAMAAARVGEPQMAVDALLKEAGPRNAYDYRGVNTGGPCPYLPGNGGLLYAVAMMAAGWDGAPDRPAPGFPADGSWVVRWEGLKRAP